MHFFLKGSFGDFEQKTWWLQLLSFCHYLFLCMLTFTFNGIYFTAWIESYTYNAAFFLD